MGSVPIPTAHPYFAERADECGAREALARAKAGGRRLLGVFCSFIPEELLLALKAVPVRLCFGQAAGAVDLPRDVCPVAQAALERVTAGPLAGLLDGLVVPTTCDWKLQALRRVAQRLPVFVVEVPRRPDPRALADEFARLAADLEEVTDFSLSAASLTEAVARVNRARAAHRRLEALRRKPVPPISGCETMLIADTYTYGDLEGWTAACEALLEAVEPAETPGRARPRLLLAGSPILWPNFTVPRLVEELGGVVVGDDFCSRTSRLQAPDVQPGPLRGMLRQLAARAVEPCTCGVLGQEAERNQVLSQAREVGAHGVVCHYLRGCAPVAAGQAGVVRALREAGLPVLTLETDGSAEDGERLRTRIEAFLEMIVSPLTPRPEAEG